MSIYAGTIMPQDHSITFLGSDSEVVLKITGNGEVHFKGERFKDEEVENAFRAFLIDQGYLSKPK